MENTIFVRNLSLFGIHGKDAILKKEKREFIFDIEVTISNTETAALTGKLKDTFDYKHLIVEAEKIIDGKPAALIETLAHSICDAVLLHEKVLKIKLTLSKRELLHGAISGIKITKAN